MKLILIKNNLKQALDSVSKICSENTNLPILKNILFRVEEGKLFLSSTNLEMAISYNCPGKIIEGGEITVPAVILGSIVSNLTSEVVNLDLIGERLHLQTDNYEASINTLPAQDFPIIPSVKQDNELKYIKIQSKKVKDSLRQAISATTISDLRPEINGILFLFDDNSLKLVGTDSFRLAEKVLQDKDYKTNIEDGFRKIIPIKTIQEILSILKDETEVEILFDNNQVLFKTSDFSLISRLIEGEFPDYKQIIPNSFGVEAVIKRKEMVNSLKVTSVLSTRIYDVNLRVNKKFIEVSAMSQGLGENKYLLPAKIKGEEIEVTFNWNYLLSGIKSFLDEDIVLGINNSEKPTVIKSLSDSSYKYILMPVKS